MENVDTLDVHLVVILRLPFWSTKEDCIVIYNKVWKIKEKNDWIYYKIRRRSRIAVIGTCDEVGVCVSVRVHRECVFSCLDYTVSRHLTWSRVIFRDIPSPGVSHLWAKNGLYKWWNPLLSRNVRLSVRLYVRVNVRMHVSMYVRTYV